MVAPVSWLEILGTTSSYDEILTVSSSHCSDIPSSSDDSKGSLLYWDCILASMIMISCFIIVFLPCDLSLGSGCGISFWDDG